ncbi:LytR C-terminal domain-containing protein, partial [Variovorax sp. 2RAF20]
YAQRLTGAGYTSVDAKNWSGYGIQSSTVLYNGSANKAAAEAVGKELGFPDMKRKYYELDLFMEHPFDGKWYGKLDYVFSRSYGNT